MDDLIAFYSAKVETYTLEIRKTKKLIFNLASLRLFSFILLVCLVYLYFKSWNNNYLTFAIISFVLFLFLVKRSNSLKQKKELLDKLHFVNTNEIDVLKEGKNKFDSGISFISNESYYADLDIFGDASLYHLLNRTSTTLGSNALSYLLQNPFINDESIMQHQDAIKTLANQHSLRENIIAKSLLLQSTGDGINNFEYWLNQNTTIIRSKWMSIARFVLPILNLITLIISLIAGHYFFLTATVLICWLHVGYFSKYIQQQHSLIGKKQEVLEQYAIILKEFLHLNPKESSLLQNLKKQASEAQNEVKKLAGLSNLLDQRMNLLVNLFLNSFLLYDVQVTIALEKWKLRNKQQFNTWMECVANIEVLTSLSTYAFNHPTFCYPTLADNLIIEANELAHPLINKSDRVTNDVSLGKPGKLLLITGSNMSGKTTYLRTLGINMVLGQCGAPVCAKSFSFKPCHLYTSIRISDSLQDHTSYFMAELKRLSSIKESISTNKPSLVMIDEILRGTNSEDKYFGSAEFMKKLIQYNCLTLFATHDLKLSEMEKDHQGVIENYCFESKIKDDELIFDYKILKGVAQNKNASFLMKKMKII